MPNRNPELHRDPRSRGDRRALSIRFDADDHEFISERADELGIHVGTFVVLTINDALGLERPWWVQRELEKAEQRRALHGEQLELPLQRAG